MFMQIDVFVISLDCLTACLSLTVSTQCKSPGLSVVVTICLSLTVGTQCKRSGTTDCGLYMFVSYCGYSMQNAQDYRLL